MCGPFELSVTFSDSAITAIDVGDNNETTMVGSEVIRMLPQMIMENQSIGVDALTGATVTSTAILSGVRDCVEQAEGNVGALSAKPVALDVYEDKKKEADIIIVGGGLAGITMAISAAENGGDVILLESKRYLGGNSVLATGTLLLGGTSIQKDLGIEDDPDTFYNWIMENSNNEKDPVQSKWIAYHSQDIVDFFAKMGVGFNTARINGTDGSDISRGHSLYPSGGVAISTMVDYMGEIGVDIRYSTHADGLILDDNNEVAGVTATDYYGNKVEYRGNKIVLASGGWGDNNDMIVKYWGESFDGLVYGGSKGMDGTMLNAAVELGAQLIDMEDQHIDATLEVTKGITITTNLLRNCGGILIRQSTGQRFADEQSHHSEDAADAMHEIGDAYYYEIFGDQAFEYSESVATRVQAYIDMGLPEKYESVEAMAEGLQVDVAALTKTLEDFNASVRGEAEDEFGRERFFNELQAPFYVMKVANGVACTTGGLKIDENMQVLNTSGAPMKGLYAIGEIAGGYLIHYVGGDSLSRSAISGMLLGQEITK
ncbi:FAD-dependent oxidoreductase, partial [Christensenellaceae bacterium OttesenSCG-928-M15]|nr:FAD-dependent oxidoreductase [Christensenellaceae bacterium OttesenSCG-928-M15]